MANTLSTYARGKSAIPPHVCKAGESWRTPVENLAWSCFACNRHKGSDLSSIDPATGRVATLFNPRKQQWKRHFRLNGPRIEPLTASGRATAFLLQFNMPDRLVDRRNLMATGDYP